MGDYAATPIVDQEAKNLVLGVRYWSVYTQQWRETWQGGIRISDQDYAALTEHDRALIDRVIDGK